LADPADPDSYATADETYRAMSFQGYASAIDDYPDGYFDVVQIDGRARPSCFKHSLRKVKPNGYLVWDNTEREHYHRAMRMAPQHFQFGDFPGPLPYVPHFTRTSVWHVLAEPQS
jgi:hypothetical protein